MDKVAYFISLGARFKNSKERSFFSPWVVNKIQISPLNAFFLNALIKINLLFISHLHPNIDFCRFFLSFFCMQLFSLISRTKRSEIIYRIRSLSPSQLFSFRVIHFLIILRYFKIMPCDFVCLKHSLQLHNIYFLLKNFFH